MLTYNTGKNEKQNWLICETAFDPKFQGKCESIFSLGNGYLGIRATTEESYVGQVRNCFVAGTFNKFDESEVTELPNAADQIAVEIWIDGERFNLEKGSYLDYLRLLDLETGELVRSFLWKNGKGKILKFEFRRFVSLVDLHLFASKINIRAISDPVEIEIKSGINGQMTNSGAQHFREGDKRIFEGKYLQMSQKTTESGIRFIHSTGHSITPKGSAKIVDDRFSMDRRQVFKSYSIALDRDSEFQLEKHSNIYTTRDKDVSGLHFDELKAFALEKLKDSIHKGYQVQSEENILKWKQLWREMDIQIASNHSFDQLAIRFAQYHLTIITPAHDDRVGIAAKGLSGEGYKGHSFWDTEIFILPFFTFSRPELARNLLIYRYNTLEGARIKARENGFKGAMFPWESAWKDDGEVTPVWGAADIITGESTKIWSGFLEQHISSDIAFAVWQYYQVTGDEDFMEDFGYEIIMDTAIFWSSRLEWNASKKEYHINDVIGPDEYKEHVNNDAFTNYMAKWCLDNAIFYGDYLSKNKPQIYFRLDKKLNLTNEIPIMGERSEKIYLPKPREDLIIPQDDEYLQKKNMDLTKYKNQEHVGSIFKDFNLRQINEIQVTKQASVVMLLYLLETKFSEALKKANFKYYESRTLHDSSLSLSTHSILAADVGDLELAYSLFQKAASIDLGPNMNSSDHGIHAASFGGIWQIIVFGFGGVRMLDGKLRISPHLPKEISSIAFPLCWRKSKMIIEVNRKKIYLKKKKGNADIPFSCHGKDYVLVDELRVEY